jgi:hypothetical protein
MEMARKWEIESLKFIEEPLTAFSWTRACPDDCKHEALRKFCKDENSGAFHDCYGAFMRFLFSNE